MKQNLGYEIDYIEEKIIVSKKFLKEARTINTAAYIELVNVRKNYPEFRIEIRQINKKENKMTYSELPYKFMRKYIETKDNADNVLKEFEKIQQLSKFQNASYAFVKKWFLGLYGDEFKRENENENGAA